MLEMLCRRLFSVLLLGGGGVRNEGQERREHEINTKSFVYFSLPSRMFCSLL